MQQQPLSHSTLTQIVSKRLPTVVPNRTTRRPLETDPLVDLIVEAIRDKKGFDILTMDLRELENPMTDVMILCSGNSDTQTKAIADHIFDHIKKLTGDYPLHQEGIRMGEWVLMDYVNVIVHVFIPRIREYYDLEDLWGDAKLTRLPD